MDADLVLFDTYPNRARVQEVKVAKDTDSEPKTVAKVLLRSDMIMILVAICIRDGVVTEKRYVLIQYLRP